MTAAPPARRNRTLPSALPLLRRYRGDLLAVGFLIGLVFCYLSPALKDGPSFGPADLGRTLSVLTSPGSGVASHNDINGDIVTQDVPWNTLDYELVHAGEFPLWNGLSGSGLPQFLNFESAALSLPALFGYLVPLSVSFLVTVALKLLIAGLGTYLALRLLACSPVAAAFGAATFMLSGSFSGWLGWALSGVVAWCGFILAGAVLAYRTRRPAALLLLAVSVAFACYGGFPESYVLVALAFVAIFVLVALGRALTGPRPSLSGSLAVLGGAVLGVGLAAPLLVGGLPVLSRSARAGKDVATGLPTHAVLLALAQGYDGLPVRGSTFFAAGTDYYEATAYLGVLAIALALLALVVGRRRPLVAALGITAVCQLLLVYRLGSHDPVQHLARLVGLGSVAVQRMLPVLGFVVALLSGIGLDAVVRAFHERVVRRSLGAATVLVTLALAAMWAKVPAAGRSQLCRASNPPLSAATCESLRRSSLYWPSALVLALLLALVLVEVALGSRPGAARRAGRLLGVAACAGQGAFLLFAGVGINSYAANEFPATPAVRALSSAVGGAIVAQDGGNARCPSGVLAGCGVRQWVGVDLYPNMNLGYGIDELAMHDPVVPKAIFEDWPVPDAGQVAAGNLNLFNPDVDTAPLARRYGASYVLALGDEHPSGLVALRPIRPAVAGLAPLELYAVPGSGRFQLRGGRIVSTAHPGDARYVVHLVAARRTHLFAAITATPGWHAAVNGVAVAPTTAPGGLLSVTVPAGADTVMLTYRPAGLFYGVAIALVCIAGLGALGVVSRRRSGAFLGDPAGSLD